LKVRYNRVFGYYIEITKSQLGRVPDDYLRKQTIAGGERFVTRELAELEAKVLAAQDTLAQREAELHRALSAAAAERCAELLAAGAAVATIDVCLSLAEVAERGGWTPADRRRLGDRRDQGRPPPGGRGAGAGRHVRAQRRAARRRSRAARAGDRAQHGRQVDLHAPGRAHRDPGAARQLRAGGGGARSACAIGSSPGSARPTTWRAATRRSWSRCARPRRSWRHATRRSLVILDEVGRGTSTFDGVSIAWAVAEYLHDAIGARTLFATHYHELTAMADDRPRVHNVSALVREQDGEVAFLRRIVPGAASKSYGIDVARLAGLPRSVIARARAILARLEGDGAALPSGRRLAQAPPGQLSLLPALAAAVDAPTAEVAQRLRALDPDRMTPIAALAALAELRALLS
jgi:DNA mismatch repair protein MutS